MTREERYISGFRAERDAVNRLLLYRNGNARYVWGAWCHRWIRIRAASPKDRKHHLYVTVMSERINRLLTIAAFPEVTG